MRQRRRPLTPAPPRGRDPAETARVAHDAAGILAAWSVPGGRHARIARARSPAARAIRAAARLSPRPPTPSPTTQLDARALPARGRATGQHRKLVPARVSCQCSGMISRTCTRCAARLTGRASSRPGFGQLRQLHETLKSIHASTGRPGRDRRDRPRTQTTARAPSWRSRRSTRGHGRSPRNRRPPGSTTTTWEITTRSARQPPAHTPERREPSSLPARDAALRPPGPVRRASATDSRFSLRNQQTHASHTGPTRLPNFRGIREVSPGLVEIALLLDWREARMLTRNVGSPDVGIWCGSDECQGFDIPACTAVDSRAQEACMLGVSC